MFLGKQEKAASAATSDVATSAESVLPTGMIIPKVASAPINVSRMQSSWTAPSDGWGNFGSAYVYTGGKLKIDDLVVFSHSGSARYSTIAFNVFLRKGQKVTISGSNDGSVSEFSGKFWPYTF